MAGAEGGEAVIKPPTTEAEMARRAEACAHCEPYCVSDDGRLCSDDCDKEQCHPVYCARSRYDCHECEYEEWKPRKPCPCEAHAPNYCERKKRRLSGDEDPEPWTSVSNPPYDETEEPSAEPDFEGEERLGAIFDEFAAEERRTG